MTDDVSQEFYDAFQTGGTCRAACDGCGRVYFGSDGHWDWEHGELEGLLKSSKDEPDKYIDIGDTVRYLDLGGRIFVDECECGMARKYENFIWAHKESILRYLKVRSDQEIQAAVENRAQVGDAASAVDALNEELHGEDYVASYGIANTKGVGSYD